MESSILQRVLDEFPVPPSGEYTHARIQEKFKNDYRPCVDQVKPYSKTVFSCFNSKEFIEYIEAVTGLTGLIPDPYFYGGGLHETFKDGCLGIHADFRLHERLHIIRRVNVIIYLNQDWEHDYGGKLELWSRDMRKKAVEVEPIFNRCVIFNTDESSFHGHSEPLNCPKNLSRKSIALYYYTAEYEDVYRGVDHTTNFKARPGSADKVDFNTKAKVFIRDLIPPVLYRQAIRMLKSNMSG